jgi:hypothetical protein
VNKIKRENKKINIQASIPYNVSGARSDAWGVVRYGYDEKNY